MDKSTIQGTILNSKKLQLFFSLFAIGILGPLSLLTMDMSHLPQPEGIELSLQVISFLNTTFLLLIALVLGMLTYRSAGFFEPSFPQLNRSLWQAIAFGFQAGILITGALWLFGPYLPNDFLETGSKYAPNLLVKLFYGGITEEILMRFGLMSVLMWILIKMTRSQHDFLYWVAIGMTSLLFAVAHLPVAFSYSESSRVVLSAYILIGNGIGGVIFGHVYWNHGLSYAMIAHAFAHLIMTVIGSLTRLSV